MNWLHKATFALGTACLLSLFTGLIGPGLALLVLTLFVGYLAQLAS